MTTEKRIEIFEKASVKKAVLLQIIPAIAAQMITLIYNLADTYFVGRLNDPDQTAAITVVASPFLLLTAVSNLFGVGGARAISHKFGEKKPDEAAQIPSIVFWLGIISGVTVSILFALLSTPILKLCGADQNTLGYAYGYAKWVIIFGGVFSILNALLANVIRAEGSSVQAATGVMAGGILNIILDPFFVLPQFLGLGAVGAGMATAISNLVASSYFIILILARKKDISLNPKYLKYTKVHIKEILLAGFPSALQYALTVVAVAAQSKFVSAYGSTAVAAFGIVKKIDQLPLFFSIGLATGLLPLLSYCHAAGDYKRRRSAFAFGTGISLSFSIFCLVLYEIFAPSLAKLFIDNAETVNYAATFLRIMVVAMPMMSVSYPMIIQFQATGKIKESIICSLLRKGLIDIPLLFLADYIKPLYGIMCVQPIVDTISLIVALMFYIRITRREKSAIKSES